MAIGRGSSRSEPSPSSSEEEKVCWPAALSLTVPASRFLVPLTSAA